MTKKIFNRKLEHKVNVWVKTLQTKEKFKENALGLLKGEVYFCEPERGILFDEETEDGEQRQDEDLVRYLTSSEHPEEKT